MAVPFACRDTTTIRKIDVTQWALEISTFSYGKVAYLCGSPDGLIRHVEDNVAKGFPISRQIVVERDWETFVALKQFQHATPSLKYLTIKHGDMLDVVMQYPVGDITHVDMDSATGWEDSYDTILQLMDMGIKTIFWTISARSSIKSLCADCVDEWTIRSSSSHYRFMPPTHADLLPKLLKQVNNYYEYESCGYIGVGSDGPGAGGSPMVMITIG